MIAGTDAGDTCGWCPTKNKAVPKTNGVVGEIVPLFKDDVYGCSDIDEITGKNVGLIPAGHCKEFEDNHPCIGPNENTGPHSKECIMHLWQKTPGVNCTTDKPLGTTVSTINNTFSGKPYSDIFKKMKALKDDITESKIYSTAKSNSIKCYGNAENVDKVFANQNVVNFFNTYGAQLDNLAKARQAGNPLAGAEAAASEKPALCPPGRPTQDAHATPWSTPVSHRQTGGRWLKCRGVS